MSTNQNNSSGSTLILSIVYSIILIIAVHYSIFNKGIESNTIINPQIEIKINNGISDTTYIYHFQN